MKLLFDLDGTLIDTNNLIFESFIHTFKVFYPNYQLSKEELYSFAGPTLEYTFKRYENNLEKVTEMIKCYVDFNISNHDKLAKGFPHVYEAIKELSINNDLAIVSSKKRPAVMKSLKLLGIQDFFKVIITSEDVSNHKPHPEGINNALSQMSGEGAIMIGDNVADLESGKNAGIKTCGVGWSLKKQDLLNFKPDLFIEDILDLGALI